MIVHKFRKIISSLLSFALTSTMIPCRAANLVPFNAGKAVITPSIPITNHITEAKPSSNGFSIQSIQSKMSDIFSSQKSKPKLKDEATIVDSGTCGVNVTWQLDSEGLLTISGSGEMSDYSQASEVPWMTKYKESIKSVKIENGVTTVSANSFYECANLENVDIPDSIIKIGAWAFYRCKNLSSIDLKDNVTDIGDNVFYECANLKFIKFGKGLTNFGTTIFSKCDNIEEVVIHNDATVDYFYKLYIVKAKKIEFADGVTRIKSRTFTSCDFSNTQLIFSSNDLNTVEEHAFSTQETIKEIIFNNEYCLKNFKNIFKDVPVNSITLGNVIENIEDGNFSGRTDLKNVTFSSNNLKSIGKDVFFGCNSLESITLNSECAISNFKSIFDNDSLKNVKILKILDDVKNVGENSFSDVNLQNAELILPNNMQSVIIADNAFNGTILNKLTLNDPTFFNTNFKETFKSTSIVNINLGNNIENIGDEVFSNRSGLQNVTFSDNLKSIGNHAFENCSDLITINFLNVTNIGSAAFKNCINLKDLIIPTSVTSIGDEAFLDCLGLKTIALNRCSVDKFSSIFGNKMQLEEVTFMEDVETITENLFEGISSLKTINIPENVNEIRSSAFKNCSGLSCINNLSNVKTIGSNAFEGCTGINSIEISNVETIGENAFKGCSSLTEITIPASVTNIGKDAFTNCTGIQDITLNKCEGFYFSDVFCNLSNLKNINVTVETISESFFAEFDFSQVVSIKLNNVKNIGNNAFSCCTGLKNFVLEKVENLGDYAFDGCEDLETIELPEVKSIGSSAFNECLNLNEIKVSNNLDTIGEHAFYSCEKLSKIDLSSVKSIGKGAFDSCNNLSVIDISKVQEIGEFAFRGTNLIEINIPASAINIGDWAFSECKALEQITLNEAALGRFNIIFNENDKNIKEVIIADGVKSIAADNSFNGCGWLTAEIKIPNTVTSIGANAFKDCSGLTSINIPASVTSIGENAFDGCTNITSVTLNNSYTLGNFKSIFPNYVNITKVTLGDSIVEGIPDNTFKGCSNLNSVSIGNNIASIGESAFSDCVALKTVSIPNKVEKINKLAFSNCKALNQVTISGNLGFVGEGAFSNCINLNNVTYNGKVPPRYDDKGTSVFSNCPELVNVSVPKDYEGDNFCGYKIDLVKRKTFKEWFNENIAWVAPAFTIVSGTVAALTFIFGCKSNWNKFVDCCGCECMQRCKFSEINEQTTNAAIEDTSSSMNQQLLNENLV